MAAFDHMFVANVSLFPNVFYFEFHFCLETHIIKIIRTYFVQKNWVLLLFLVLLFVHNVNMSIINI